MIKPVIGRIDYESKTKFIELKTKPPNLRKVKGKEEWNMITQDLPTEPTIENLTNIFILKWLRRSYFGRE
jgi:hypothetical protein